MERGIYKYQNQQNEHLRIGAGPLQTLAFIFVMQKHHFTKESLTCIQKLSLVFVLQFIGPDARTTDSL